MAGLEPDCTLVYGYLESPVGPLLFAGDAEGLRRVRFSTEDRSTDPIADWRRDDAYFEESFRQFRAWFAGELTEFDLPLRPVGTEFQQSVWTALQSIPFGETTTYGEIAARVGRPKASRAVGAANGANPLPIAIPCHRVIGSNRSLTGFGGGIEIKRYLLNHESGHSRCGDKQGNLPF